MQLPNGLAGQEGLLAMPIREIRTYEFQGQIIDENTNISTSVRRSHTAGDSLVRTKTLYSSSFEIPPERKTDPGKSIAVHATQRRR